MGALVLIFILLNFKYINGSYNASGVMEKQCTVRYDIKVGFGNANFQDPNCTQYGLIQPYICDDELKISYFELPPYIMTTMNGRVDGIVPAILKLAVSACCNHCTRIKYTKQIKTTNDLRDTFLTNNYSIFLPALGVKDADNLFGVPFLQLVTNPGVSYIEIDRTSDVIMEKLVGSIASTWPLFVILLLLTVMGGIIIWILDAKSNSEEFPPGFFKGIMEGGWWAYVSMTTIGYGDKTPKSYSGRLFSIIWTSVGLGICSMFTATLSSSLTSALMVGQTNLKGKDVGVFVVFDMGYEANVIYREGGKPKGYYKVSKMVDDLKDGKLDGILMDKYVLRLKWEEIKSAGMELAINDDIIRSETAVGAIFANEEIGKWATFLRAFFNANKDAEDRLIANAIDEMINKLPDEIKGQKALSDPFASPTVIKNVIGSLAIATCVMFAAVLLFTRIKNFHQRKKIKRIPRNDIEFVEKVGNDSMADETKKFNALATAMEEKLLICFREHVADLKQEMESDMAKNPKNT